MSYSVVARKRAGATSSPAGAAQEIWPVAIIKEPAMPRVAVVYALFVKSAEYVENVFYFLRNGVFLAPDVTFFMVCNDQDAPLLRDTQAAVLEEASARGVHVLRRPNRGFDFAGWGAAIQHFGLLSAVAEPAFTHFIFLNTSCRGPFMPAYASCLRWTDAFISQLGATRTSPVDGRSSTVRLVGPTINVHVERKAPHVQSYAFATDAACLAMLWAAGLFAHEFSNIADVIATQELGLSTLVLAHGGNISAFVNEYTHVDYLNPAVGAGTSGLPSEDIVYGTGKYAAARCLGRDLHPMEVMFIKTSRGVAADAIKSLTECARALGGAHDVN